MTPALFERRSPFCFPDFPDHVSYTPQLYIGICWLVFIEHNPGRRLTNYRVPSLEVTFISVLLETGQVAATYQYVQAIVANQMAIKSRRRLAKNVPKVLACRECA